MRKFFPELSNFAKPVISNFQISNGDLYIREDGSNTATFDVTITQPYNVTVNVSLNNSYATVDKSSLTFTTSDYNTPQTVTVTGQVNSPNGLKYDDILLDLNFKQISKEIRIVDSNIDSGIYDIEPLSKTNWTTESDLNTLRQSTIDWVWGTGYGNGDGSLPNTSISNISSFAGDSYIALDGFTNLGDAQRGNIIMGDGTDWTVYFYILNPSIANNGSWFVVPTGHGDDWTGPGDTNGYELLLDSLLGEGYKCIFYYMVGRGPNTTESGITQGTGGNGGTHDQMSSLESSSPYFNPLNYFLTPSIAAINYAESQSASNIYITGISGGGWTTDWIGALDKRIDKSFHFSGSHPRFINDVNDNVDFDYEQGFDDPDDPGSRTTTFLTDQYDRVSYLDLYCLAAQNKEYYKFHNINDTCCFMGYYYTIYKEEVQKKLKYGSIGTFNIFSYNVSGHRYTINTINQILELI